VTVDGRVLGFAALLALLTGLLFGLAPAWHAAKADLQLTLKSGERSLNAGSRVRSLLVVAEIALALVLLIGAGLLSKSFLRLLNVTPGFEASNLVTMIVPAAGTKYEQEDAVRHFYRAVLGRVSKLPGVDAAGIVSNLPLSGNGDRSGFHIEEKPLPNPADAPSIERFGVSPDFLRTMRISLLRGRGFTEQDDENAPLVVMISQTAAQRFWPNEDPLGKRVRLGGPSGRLRTIIGIVPDVLHHGLDDGPDIQAYVPHAQWSAAFMQLAVRTTADPTSLLNAIRNEVHAVDKDIPIYQVATMEQLMATTTAQRRFTLLLAGVFAALSLVLAGLGIYSVIAYAVTQRTHEIGLRMALGAQGRDVLQLIIGQGMKLALAGLVIGLAASFALTRLMESLLFGVSPTDPLTFGLVTLLLLTVTLLACWVPAKRATKLDPLHALRYE
jgi:putative ABC transport system permease protein